MKVALVLLLHCVVGVTGQVCQPWCTDPNDSTYNEPLAVKCTWRDFEDFCQGCPSINCPPSAPPPSPHPPPAMPEILEPEVETSNLSSDDDDDNGVLPGAYAVLFAGLGILFLLCCIFVLACRQRSEEKKQKYESSSENLPA
jgi:hypothetical protein